VIARTGETARIYYCINKQKLPAILRLITKEETLRFYHYWYQIAREDTVARESQFVAVMKYGEDSVKVFKMSLLSIVITLSCAQTSSAQRLYNQERDEQAQAAKKLADQIENSAVFDKQVRNLLALERQYFAVYFMEARRDLRADVNSITNWKDIDTIVKKAEAKINKPNQYSPSEIQQVQEDLEKRVAEAKQALKDFKDKIAATENQELISLLDHVGELGPLHEYGEQLLSEDRIASVKQLTQLLETLKTIYEAYTERLKAIEEQIAELKLPLMQIAIQRLQLEEEHWKNLGVIQTRRTAEEEDIWDLILDYRARTGPDQLNVAGSDEHVEKTLQRVVQSKDREKLVNAILALHVATAIAARGSTPANLAEVRVAQEHHRYSIRQSAVMARAYELTVSTGVQRLALYHKGGIKPETIALLIHTVATAAIPATIATK
jgi:hypothetical protein